MTTNDYLDAIKQRYNLPTDYQLFKFSGFSKSRISSWRKRGVCFDDEAAIRVAELLDIDPLEVLASVNAERTKCPEAKKVWEKAAKRLATAASICFVLVLSGVPDTADASEKHFKQSNNIYYAQLVIARIFWLICSFMGLDLSRSKTTL